MVDGFATRPRAKARGLFWGAAGLSRSNGRTQQARANISNRGSPSDVAAGQATRAPRRQPRQARNALAISRLPAAQCAQPCCGSGDPRSGARLASAAASQARSQPAQINRTVVRSDVAAGQATRARNLRSYLAISQIGLGTARCSIGTRASAQPIRP